MLAIEHACNMACVDLHACIMEKKNNCHNQSNNGGGGGNTIINIIILLLDILTHT